MITTKQEFEGEYKTLEQIGFQNKRHSKEFKTVYLVEISFSAKINISRFDIFLVSGEDLTGWLWEGNKKNINTISFSFFSNFNYNKMFNTLEQAELYMAWLILNGFNKGEINILPPQPKDILNDINLDDIEK